MIDFSVWALPTVIVISIIVSTTFSIIILKNTKNSQTNNNRPWIISHTLPHEESSIKIDITNKLIRFRFINSGKSPAHITGINAYMSNTNEERKELFKDYRKNGNKDDYGGIGPNEWGIIKPSFEELLKHMKGDERCKILEKIDNYKDTEIKEGVEAIFYFGFSIEYESLLLKGKKLFYKVHLKAVKVCEKNDEGKAEPEIRRDVESVEFDKISV